MKRIFQYITITIGACIIHSNTFGQVITKENLINDFEQFKKESSKDFKKFVDERDKEFADLLKKQWTAFNLQPSATPELVPKPPKQPSILPKAPEQKNKGTIPVIKIIEIKKPKVEPNIDSPLVVVSDLLPNQTIVPFYSNQLTVFYNNNLLATCKDVNEKGVGKYWEEMGTSNYPPFLLQIKTIGKQLQLNDWGYFELIRNIGTKLLSNENDQSLFIFFMLNHLNFDTKIAKRDNNFILLVPFKSTIYKKTYVTINNRKYYLINNESGGSIQTLSQKFSDANKSLDLSIDTYLKLGGSYSEKSIYFKKYDTTIVVKYNKNLLDFYNQIPMTDLSVFFSSKIDPVTEVSLNLILGPLVENKNELEAVNIILDFVQNSFEYKTDFNQFGYEKFNFPEETIFYNFSDCEDRAILFSHLVKNLLKLDVIGLEYKTHAACAVKFNADVNGDGINFDNKKYIICDPTYIGASAGMSMPQFANENPKIVLTK